MVLGQMGQAFSPYCPCPQDDNDVEKAQAKRSKAKARMFSEKNAKVG